MQATKPQGAALHSVFERVLHEQRRALYGWSLGLGALALLEIAMYPTVRSNPTFAKLGESYPEALRSLFNISDFTSGTGYLRTELFSVIVPMLVVVVGVLWGGDAIAGEEERGTIDLLLANPVSRRRVLLEKWAALLAGILAVCAALSLGLAIGIPATGMHAGFVAVAAAIVATALLGALFATVALALSAATGRRGLARGVTTALAVAAYLVSSLADLVSWLKPLRPLSPWYHALGIDPLKVGFAPVHLLVLAGLTAVFLLAGIAAFDRRDLAV